MKKQRGSNSGMGWSVLDYKLKVIDFSILWINYPFDWQKPFLLLRDEERLRGYRMLLRFK
jgi:hypothetical protein